MVLWFMDGTKTLWLQLMSPSLPVDEVCYLALQYCDETPEAAHFVKRKGLFSSLFWSLKDVLISVQFLAMLQ